MLSIGKIKVSGENYYLSAVADGVDEYYRGVGEAPGRWAGSASRHLRLDGEVQADELHAVWAGQHPVTGEPLGRFPNRKVAGFDLTFRAPKSVSILAGLADPDTARAVRFAHEAAVDAAFAYVEREAARSRTGKNGVHEIEVNGLVAAGFRHRTSRAGDPHLHTHLLVANMAEGVDGRWRTLDGRLLYLHASTSGYLYEAHLRRELTERLGVEWGPVRHGIADIVGIDQEVRDHFSDRRREIEEHLDELGFRTARAAQLATLATRRSKRPMPDDRSMRGVWRSKAAEIGWDPAALDHVVDRVTREAVDIDRAALGDDLVGPDGLTRRASSFNQRDLLRAICDRLPAGATVADVEDVSDQVTGRVEVVRLVETDRTGLLSSDVIRRTDGSVVAATTTAERRWSTVELVGIERHLVDRSTARAYEGAGVVSDEVLDAVLARRPTLAAEQAEMVTELTTSGNGIDVVSAAAGTGKTYTLDAAREAWEASGHRVIGAALAGIAAQELQSTAAISSSTLAMLQIDLDARRVELDDRTVVIIDEAGMAGTRTLAPILDAADGAGAKVVLVGDPHQLPEIDAGGVITGLTKRLVPIELSENRRQRSQWERQALEELRRGDVDTAFAAYCENQRIVSAPTAIDVRNAMVADWWSHRVAGDSVAMSAYRRDDVDDLNGRARAYLIRAGEVSGPELVVDDRPFQAGDQIVCLKNERRLGVCNGTKATIDTVHPGGRTVTVIVDGASVMLPASYLDAGHVAHGYATTIHKTQGATVDRGLVLGTDELFRQRGYVALSRGRITNHLYLLGAGEPDDASGHGLPPVGKDPAEAVQRALHRQDEKVLAIDTGEPPALWPIEDLVAEKHRLSEVLSACPPDRSHGLKALDNRYRVLHDEIAPLVRRYNDLADRTLRGSRTRAEMQDLRLRISDLTDRFDAISSDERDARSEATSRGQFLDDHAQHINSAGAVDEQIDNHLIRPPEYALDHPTEDHLEVLGPVPVGTRGRVFGAERAIILERRRLRLDEDGIDPEPASPVLDVGFDINLS